MSWAAIIVGVVGVGVSAGIAAANQPDAPEAPDLRAATREGFLADIETLPRRKEIEAAARLGKTLFKEGYRADYVSDAFAELSQRNAELPDALNVVRGQIGQLENEMATLLSSATSQTRLAIQTQYGLRIAALRAEEERLNDELNQTQVALAGVDEGQPGLVYFDPQGRVVSREEAVEADFAGISDIEQSIAVARAQLDFLPEAAQAKLDLQAEFGEKFINQQLSLLQAADPVGFEIRRQMGESILSEGFGFNLSESQRSEVEQAARSAQAARGNLFGAAPAAAEALQVGDAAFRLRQQRLANAAAFLSGETPQAQFGQISNAQQGAAPAGSFSLIPGVGPNPNAGAIGAQFASNIYGQQSQNYAVGLQNDPWQSLLGSVSQVGLNLVAQGAFGARGSAQPAQPVAGNFPSNPYGF